MKPIKLVRAMNMFLFAMALVVMFGCSGHDELYRVTSTEGGNGGDSTTTPQSGSTSAPDGQSGSGGASSGSGSGTSTDGGSSGGDGSGSGDGDGDSPGDDHKGGNGKGPGNGGDDDGNSDDDNDNDGKDSDHGNKNDSDNKKKEKQEDLGDCAAKLGVPVDRIVVAGNQSDIKLSPEQALAIRITGNMSRVRVEVAAGHPIKGICAVLRGNLAQLEMSIGAKVDKVHYSGGGNLSSGEINIAEGGSMGEIDLSMKGNGPSLSISGAAGSYTCPANPNPDHATVKCQ